MANNGSASEMPLNLQPSLMSNSLGLMWRWLG